MSRLATAFVLGYHGCDKATADKVLDGHDEHLKASQEDFDWLGTGAYFWEADPRRALEWARDRKGIRKFQHPYVIGAVIDLRNCLDLTVREDIETLARYFEDWKRQIELANWPMPENGDRTSDGLDDKLFRYRDCAVINFMHDEIARDPAKTEPFDTVRGMFQEGPPAFEGAGFRAKSHTQIAVKNSDCIKGYFRPRPYPA